MLSTFHPTCTIDIEAFREGHRKSRDRRVAFGRPSTQTIGSLGHCVFLNDYRMAVFALAETSKVLFGGAYLTLLLQDAL